MSAATSRSATRLAVVRLSALGDVVLATAVLDAARALNRDHRLAFVTRTAYAPLLAHDTRVDTLIHYDSNDPGSAGRALRDFAPDHILDLQVTLRSDRLTRGLAGVKRARMRKETLRRRLAVAGLRSLRADPVIDRALDALAYLLDVERTAVLGTPRLSPSADTIDRATRRLPDGRLWIGMSPGSQWRNKAWPVDRFAEVASAVADREGMGVAVFLGPTETDLAAAFEGHPHVRVIQPPLAELPAHFSRLRVLLTGDTGPLHVAEAVGVPVVAIFGPTTDQFGFGPHRSDSVVIEHGLWCRPCHVHGGNRCPLRHHRCMLDISSVEVLNTVDRAIGLVSASDL